MDKRLPWKPGSKIYQRRKRRATQLEMLLVEHEMAVNELKYESRLEFGTGSKPSEATGVRPDSAHNIMTRCYYYLLDQLSRQPSRTRVRNVHY